MPGVFVLCLDPAPGIIRSAVLFPAINFAIIRPSVGFNFKAMSCALWAAFQGLEQRFGSPTPSDQVPSVQDGLGSRGCHSPEYGSEPVGAHDHIEPRTGGQGGRWPGVAGRLHGDYRRVMLRLMADLTLEVFSW